LRFKAVIRGARGVVAVLPGLTLPCLPAIAGDWKIVPRVSGEELYTDNVNLSQQDKQSDFITIIRPGISIEREGAARSHLSLDYSLDFTRYLRDTQRKSTRQYLQAEAGAEVIEDIFFVDGEASITQQSIVNTGAESGTAITDNSNRTEVVSTSVNPNIRHHFRNWADSRFDYVLSHVQVADESIDTTTTQRYGTVLSSGREFSLLRWTAETRTQTTEHSNSNREDERRLAQLTMQYTDRLIFQPIASVGFEQIKDNTLTSPPDGLIWSLGGLFQPGPRTRIEATHGQRYGDPNTSLDASYDLSARTTIKATYSQVLETSQSLSLSELTSPTSNLSQANSGFSLTNSAFLQTDFTTSVDIDHERNDYRFEYRWSERKTDSDGSVNTVQSLNALWTREMTRAMNGRVNLGYRTTDFGPTQNRQDDLITYGVSVDYRLQTDLRAGLGYTGTRKISTSSGSSYTENSISFTLTAQF
jgi:uncharacterized protein (PEP-CTERM system associated)